MAILTKTELLLVVIGGIFVMEALSVIIQVISFKTRGVRVFKMSLFIIISNCLDGQNKP